MNSSIFESINYLMLKKKAIKSFTKQYLANKLIWNLDINIANFNSQNLKNLQRFGSNKLDDPFISAGG